MSEMKSRRGVVRGVAVLVVGFLAAGAFAIGPVGAGKFLTKKKALKLFYTKGAADSRFINVGETASDSDRLDGLDSTEVSSVVGKRRDWGTAGEIFNITATPVKVLQVTPSAPRAGQFLINYSAWVFGDNSEALMWVEVDRPTDCAAGGQIPPGRVPGSLLSVDLETGHFYDSLGGAVSVPVGAGSHKVTLCVSRGITTNNTGVIDASLTALYSPGGSTTVITTPGATRTSSGPAGAGG